MTFRRVAARHSAGAEQAQLFALLEALPLGSFVLRLEDPKRAESLRIVFANSASEDMLGVEPSSVVGGLLAEQFPNTMDESGLASVYRAAILDQTPRDLGVISYGDDRIRQNRFSVSAYPVAPDLLVLLFDNLSAAPARVTELAAIVASADDAILSKDLNGTILTWNASAERIYGYTDAEAIGRPISMLLPPDRPTEIADILGRLAAGERIDQLETTRVRKDGTMIDVSLTVSPIVDAHGRVVGAATIARDCGIQKQAEARAQQLAAIVDTSDDAIFSRQLDGSVTSWNASAERLFGYSADEMIGQSFEVLTIGSDPELAETRARLSRGGRQAAMEIAMRRKDGSEIEVSAAAAPMTDSAGRVTGIAAVIRDVTERRRLEEQLRQAQKMEAIGSLAGGVAHDFNNVLTVIRNTCEVILKSLDDEPLRKRVGQIDLAAEHAATLTQQLLAFSRQQLLQPVPTDLNTVVDATLGLVERVIGAPIELQKRFEADLSLIHVDPGQLQQVILNLSINARDAMPNGGTITVRTSSVVLDERYAAEHVEVTAGPYVLLEITDSGVGMDTATLDRIFDPFFTTKPTGTGLGLATVYGIVKQSGGHISVYSEPELGTTFRVYLRLSGATARAPELAPPDPGSFEGGETILLVEDAEMLRPIIVELLESFGYAVLAAASGSEAIALAEGHQGTIDLLLTDVVMPGMNGRELSALLLKEHPAMSVLFTSGYPADTIVRFGIAEGRVAFIQKPYVGNELFAKVRETLATAP